MIESMISGKDRLRLRSLARRQAELATSDHNRNLYRDWEGHANPASGTRPMVLIDSSSFEHEILPQLTICEGAHAREIERRLLRLAMNFEMFGDDTLVPAYYPVLARDAFIPFGLKVREENTDGLGRRYIPYLHALQDDWALLEPSEYGIDEAGARRDQAEAEETFGDILPVLRISEAFSVQPTKAIVQIMSMEE